MKWSNTITLQQPLLDVRLLTRAPVLDWQDHLRDSERTAYEQGRRDGERVLGEQLLQQRNEIAELQNGVISSLKQMLPQIAREMESTLIELALEAAKKIVNGVKIDAKIVETVVREALTQVQDTSDVSIRLHAEDLALLRKHKSPLLEGLPETGPLRFTASDDVSRGGCIVQTRFGLIDAQRETKLELLRKAVGL
jgi:flagellar assembly protein FliH